MRIAKVIVIVVSVALISFLTTVGWYLGAFKEVKVYEAPLEERTLIYKLHIGAFHKIVESITEVETWVRDHDGTCDLSFGEYFTDPREVDEELLRSHAGCVVRADFAKELPKGFEMRTISYPSTVQAEFTGSSAIGPFKVYPKVFDYLEEKNYGEPSVVFEFYRVEGRDVTTNYVFPLQGSEND